MSKQPIIASSRTQASPISGDTLLTNMVMDIEMRDDMTDSNGLITFYDYENPVNYYYNFIGAYDIYSLYSIYNGDYHEGIELNDGGNNLMAITDGAYSLLPFTFSINVYFETLRRPPTNNILLSKGVYGALTLEYIISIYNNILQLNIRKNSSTEIYYINLPDYTFYSGTYYNIVITCNGIDIKMYVDGVEYTVILSSGSAAPYNTPISSVYPLIGRIRGVSSFDTTLEAEISYIRWWNTYMTAIDVDNLWNGGTPVYHPDLALIPKDV